MSVSFAGTVTFSVSGVEVGERGRRRVARARARRGQHLARRSRARRPLPRLRRLPGLPGLRGPPDLPDRPALAGRESGPARSRPFEQRLQFWTFDELTEFAFSWSEPTLFLGTTTW